MSGRQGALGGVPADVPVAWSNPNQSSRSARPSVEPEATTTTRSVRHASSPPRLGRVALAALRQSLSARDWQVLRGVAQHRYLTTRQVESLYFHGHATSLSAARVCRRVLHRLATLRILTHLERRVGGVRAGSASYVWQVGPVGDRLLRSEASPRKRRYEPGRLFLDHCLAVADLHVDLVRASGNGDLELVEVQLEPDCWRPYSGLGGARLVLQPDLYVVTGDPTDPAFVNCWFVEVDRGTEHPARLLLKCTRYEAYRFTGAEQTGSGGGFPLVAWVMSDARQADRLSTAIERDRTLDTRLYRVTTAEQFVSLIRGGAS